MTLDNQTAAGGALPALNTDGIDVRLWWDLTECEQADRMERHNTDWWKRYTLASAANALRTGIIKATEGLL